VWLDGCYDGWSAGWWGVRRVLEAPGEFGFVVVVVLVVAGRGEGEHVFDVDFV